MLLPCFWMNEESHTPHHQSSRYNRFLRQLVSGHPDPLVVALLQLYPLQEISLCWKQSMPHFLHKPTLVRLYQQQKWKQLHSMCFEVLLVEQIQAWKSRKKEHLLLCHHLMTLHLQHKNGNHR